MVPLIEVVNCHGSKTVMQQVNYSVATLVICDAQKYSTIFWKFQNIDYIHKRPYAIYLFCNLIQIQLREGYQISSQACSVETFANFAVEFMKI